VLEVLREGERYPESDLHRAQREAARLAGLRLYTTADHALLIAEQRARAMLDGYWPLVQKTARALDCTWYID
jgi:hypothetical protein